MTAEERARRRLLQACDETYPYAASAPSPHATNSAWFRAERRSSSMTGTAIATALASIASVIARLTGSWF